MATSQTDPLSEATQYARLPFRRAHPLDQGLFKIIGMLGDDAPKAFEHLMHRLMKFGLARIAPTYRHGLPPPATLCPPR